MISSIPSPFTSPALDTFQPKWSFELLPVIVAVGSSASDPKATKKRDVNGTRISKVVVIITPHAMDNLFFLCDSVKSLSPVITTN